MIIRKIFAKIVEKIASNPKNLNNSIMKAADTLKNGVKGFTKNLPGGKQIWAETRGNKIVNAGINIIKKGTK